MILPLLLSLLLPVESTATLPEQAPPKSCVILLHGLARTAGSMETMAAGLVKGGHAVVNVDYPSRDAEIAPLAAAAITGGVKRCEAHAPEVPIDFVTHSLGGILVRFYLTQDDIPRLGRVVMLAPPNQGSEVVDNLRDVPGFELINGPAGLQLGTGEDSVPRQLGPVAFTLGVIAGSETFNPILSQWLPNPDDGKVSVESTKVEGMSDFLIVAASHPFIMGDDEVISQVLYFLEKGVFRRESESLEAQGF
ncbi:MAG: alpha/beta fold hydrolase [Acidobacteriota bacterium]